MTEKNFIKRIKRVVLEYWLDYPAEPQCPSPVRSAVLFLVRHIGDTMAAYPAIRALQAAHIPNIVLIVREGSFESVAPLSNEGITIHTVPHERDRKRLRRVAQDIREHLGQVDFCIQGMTRETTASLLFLRQLKARTNLGLHESRLSMYLPDINHEAVRMHDALVPANICWAHPTVRPLPSIVTPSRDGLHRQNAVPLSLPVSI